MNGEVFAFAVLAAVAVVFSIFMLTRKSALDGALCLIVAFLSFAGLYRMLDAPFVAAMQVLVYAGAIMMLIIFAIMTIESKSEFHLSLKPLFTGTVAAGILVAVITTLFVNALEKHPPIWSSTKPVYGSVELVGKILFTRHVLNFEMVSLLLLVALVGALVLGKKSPQQSGSVIQAAPNAPQDNCKGQLQ
jgi:NADH-quinone oxidoreductase subunit J